MSRYNHLMAASLVFVCAILCLDSRARGACDPAVAICITQNPSESENVPQSWEIREVEPFGDPYVYEVDLHFIGEGNRDGAVNGTDLDIAELYLDWQYCCEAPQGFTKIADGFAQLDLDNDPAAMSEPMTVTQAVVAMGYADIGHFGASFEAMEAPARGPRRGRC